jgi:hypothetical protein
MKIFKSLILFSALLLVLSTAALASQDATETQAPTLKVVVLVAIVTASTQTVKKGLEALLKRKISPGIAFGLSVVVAFFTVAINALRLEHPFNGALLFVLVQVIIYSSGTFLLIKKVAPSIPK